MATWRQKGYVLDSDDDGESQESTSHEDATTSVDCHTNGGHEPQPKTNARAEELPHTLGKGCCGQQETEFFDERVSHQNFVSTGIPAPNYVTSHEELLFASPPGRSSENDTTVTVESPGRSRDSSPLSEAPSTLPDLTDILASDIISKERFKEAPTGSHVIPSESLEELSHDLLTSFDESTKQGRPGLLERSFRSRKPIQLHPYMIEVARYNKVQRDHGLKPVRMHQEEETQLQPQESRELLSSRTRQGTLSSSSSVESSPVREDSSPHQHLQFSGEEEEDTDVDFPDIDTLLNLPLFKKNSSGNKRRRIGSIKGPEMSRDMSPTIRRIDSSTTMEPAAIRATTKRSSPSLPSSNTQTPLMQANPGTSRFRVPRFVSSRRLPTPITSSTSKRSLTPRPFTNDLSDDQGSSEDPAEPVLARKGSLSDDEDNEDKDDETAQSEIRHAQRRIRGVLPASWLKLDLKAQADKSNSNNDLRKSTTPEASPRRGVARAKPRAVKGGFANQSSRHQISLTTEDFYLDSDTDEESGADRPAQTLTVAEPETIYQDIQENFVQPFDEAEEDDIIDPMLPPTKVRRVYQKRKVKRQRRLTDFNLERSHAVETVQNSAKKPKKLPARTGPDKSRQEFRVEEPKLSILDALVSQIHKPAVVPSFIKVAARTARSRRDQGRSNISGKRFLLATKTDTRDVRQTIEAWQEGSIAPIRFRNPLPDFSRRPLEPRPLNAPLTPSHQLVSDTSATAGIDPGQANGKQRPRVRPPDKVESTAAGSLQNSVALKPHYVGSSKLLSTPDLKNSILKKRAKPRKLSRSIRNTNETRQAILQGSVTAQNPSHQRLHLFNKPEATADAVEQGRRESPLPTHEYIPIESTVPLQFDHRDQLHPLTFDKSAKGKSVRRRKRLPRRRPLLNDEHEGPLDSVEIVALSDDDNSFKHRAGNPVIVGLNPSGVEYSDNFEIKALPAGVCFDDSTYIGSGQLHEHLKFKSANELNNLRSTAVFQFGGETFRWGAWDENVSSQMGEVIVKIREIAQDAAGLGQEQRDGALAEVTLAQNALFRYFSCSVSFLDPIDRIAFLQRSKTLLDDFFCEVSKSVGLNTAEANHQSGKDSLLRIAVLNMILVDKILQIAEHTVVPTNTSNEIKSLLSASTRWVCACIQRRFDSFLRTLSKLRLNGGTEYVLNENDCVVEALIIVRHTSDRACLDTDGIWDVLFSSTFHQKAENSLDIKQNERCWHRLFTLLPFLEFDDRGIVKPGRRFQVEASNWALVKKLIGPALRAYQKETSNTIPGFNEYCRALFRRCLSLINDWGWFRCESIIGTLFDFFARNGLAHLKHEENHGSPSFLSMLGSNPRLDAEPQDRCFHLLLKIIGSGLRRMRIICPHRKIRDLVWRLMPNHGRSHPKEQSVKQEDLDALRNHHDLLCTLYWASPPGLRLAPSAVRNLVDLGNSHREACHIAIRSWTNLIKFQLSLKEPEADLQVFLQWHNDILHQMLVQHQLARTEAEDQVKSHSNLGIASFPISILESTILSNQKQLEAIIEDALVSLQVAIDSSTSRAIAADLISSAVAEVWSLFDASKLRTNRAIMSALEVILVFRSKFFQRSKQTNLQSESDDSQDYGDWTIFANEAPAIDLAQDKPDGTIRHMLQVTPNLKALLSNCLGADQAPNDDFLSKLVDAWVAAASILVGERNKSWGDYVDHCGKDSWASMRDTTQTRKYTAYFLASAVNADTSVYHENRESILRSWVVCLVERESRLKYQHLLTSALLNAGKDDVLLFNLPFSKSKITGLFDISLTELSTRRLSLLSCLISNMRASLDASGDGPHKQVYRLSQECKELLQSLMSAIKRNYEELGPGIEAQGAYVEFAHSVVQVLQEHATGICPVDRFFTDSAAFPLPPSDPSYVTGQLKYYSIRMTDSSMPKQLAVFLQSCSERAAIDGQQLLWSDQLLSAMTSHPRDRSSMFALPVFLIKVAMPAYATLAFQTSCGWILAMPILTALLKMNRELHLYLDGYDQTSVRQVGSVIYGFLRSMYMVLAPHIVNSTFKKTIQAFKVSAACYEGLVAMLPLLNHIGLLGHSTKKSLALLGVLTRIADRLYDAFSASEEDYPALDIHIEQSNSISLPRSATFSFTIGYLRESLDKYWWIEDNVCFFSKGGSRRRINVDVGLVEEERDKLKDILGRLRSDLDTFPFLSRAIRDLRLPITEGDPSFGIDIIL